MVGEGPRRLVQDASDGEGVGEEDGGEGRVGALLGYGEGVGG